MKKFIIFFSLLIFIGCETLDTKSKTPEKSPEVETEITEIKEEVKTEIETGEPSKTYEIKDKEILFYSEDQRIIKRIDLIKRREEEFNDNGIVFSTRPIPTAYEKILKNNTQIQRVSNSFGKNKLIKSSNVYLYGYLDNTILYEYDSLMRLSSERYIDPQGELYIKKTYKYSNNYRIVEKRIFDAKGAFLEEEVFSYIDGILSKITLLSGDGKVLSTKNFIYDETGSLREERLMSGKINTRLVYKKDSLGRVDRISEYSSGKYRGYYQLIYDSKERLIEKRFYSMDQTVVSKEIYKY
ncbi:hypothetical protein [uncultured Ilyobacter sp.]|uniref:hypothetical protein n=1 Tax=uncultured Ilyobacter sp. TaxID=544433 RepID=UPI0029F466E5|nr:hypothetical protein [uncultured Ilyobacter sp.]